MKLNLGNFVIDLNSPSTLVVFLALLFGAMILASYAGQPVKKFIRTNSGRLTTKRPTPKINEIPANLFFEQINKKAKKLIKKNKKIKFSDIK